MTRYMHDVVLFIDVSKKEDADGPRDDRSFIRKKSPVANVRRFIYRPERNWPLAEGGLPGESLFYAEVQRLANQQPSRLTLLAHGFPKLLAPYPRNGYPGFSGVEMATRLRNWGLRSVSRISVIACHGAVNEKLFLLDDEMPDASPEKRAEERRKRNHPHFGVGGMVPGANLFGTPPPEVVAANLEQQWDEESTSLIGSFAQEFHLALADGSLPRFPVRTEVSARIMRTKTSSSGQNYVEFPYQVMGFKDELDEPMTHSAPGSKIIFYWNGITQAARVEQYPVYQDPNGEDESAGARDQRRGGDRGMRYMRYLFGDE